jgi:hypothetical protein
MITPIDYNLDNTEIQPSLYYESENWNNLLASIFKPYQEQQEDFIWLSQNILNIDVAERWHLDFIGNIVGQDRFLVDFNVEPYFGFLNSYNSETFGTITNPNVGGIWKSRSGFDTSSARRLNDDEYRRVIKARTIFNASSCNTNDLVEIINLITDNDTAKVQTMYHGLIRISATDTTGLLAYFVDHVNLEDNILPIPAGVRVELSE